MWKEKGILGGWANDTGGQAGMQNDINRAEFNLSTSPIFVQVYLPFIYPPHGFYPLPTLLYLLTLLPSNLGRTKDSFRRAQATDASIGPNWLISIKDILCSPSSLPYICRVQDDSYLFLSFFLSFFLPLPFPPFSSIPLSLTFFFLLYFFSLPSTKNHI